MAFFDDLGKKISQTGQDAVKKTKEMADVARLNSQIDDVKKATYALYSQLGGKYYELFSENPDERLAGLCSSIKDSIQKIADLQEQLMRAKGIVKCPACGADNVSEAVFCRSCGAAMKPQQAAPEGAAVCPACGKVNNAGAAFCSGCGAKLPEAAPEPEAAQNLCPSCGAELGPGMAFCPQCGQKIG